MNTTTLAEISDVLSGRFSGANANITAISIDSRIIKAGELFVAIPGPNFDGHDYISQAAQKGASAVLVSYCSDTTLPFIKVDDTVKALGKLAAHERKKFPIPMIAVTGSCGKTTAKTMMAAIMAQKGKVLASKGTMNNDIGLPLTLLQLNKDYRYAVIEIGANHFGEIEYLSKVAQPDVAVITNIGPAHLEYFGDLAGVAKAKGEIFTALRQDGTVVLNADDNYADYLRSLIGQRKCITFAIEENAAVKAEQLQSLADGTVEFTLVLEGEKEKIKLPTLGKHNVSNALAASAATHALGASIAEIKVGLETMQPVAKRLIRHKGQKGSLIIDDTYNAIPNAIQKALEVLAKLPGKKVFVFGGMAELNPIEAEELYKIIGHQAHQYGVQQLFAIGELAHLTVEAFGAGAEYFQNKAELITRVKNNLEPDMTVLIKGSRGARMEEVVAELVAKGC